MLKFKIHIANISGDLFDPKVSVEIKLPAVPRIGDTLYLEDEQINSLTYQAKASIETLRPYLISHDDYLLLFKKGFKENINNINLNFNDHFYIYDVLFKANDEYIYIELSDISPISKITIEDTI